MQIFKKGNIFHREPSSSFREPLPLLHLKSSTVTFIGSKVLLLLSPCHLISELCILSSWDHFASMVWKVPGKKWELRVWNTQCAHLTWFVLGTCCSQRSGESWCFSSRRNITWNLQSPLLPRAPETLESLVGRLSSLSQIAVPAATLARGHIDVLPSTCLLRGGRSSLFALCLLLYLLLT